MNIRSKTLAALEHDKMKQKYMMTNFPWTATCLPDVRATFVNVFAEKLEAIRN